MDFGKLGEAAAQSPSLPPIVQGRVCQCDADTLAYDCTNLENSLAANWQELKTWIEEIRIKSGSEFMNLHLTMDRKGGRFEMATIKPYQENRKNRDEDKQRRVWELRHKMASYMTDKVKAVAWYHQEADDGMAQFQLERIAEHGEESSIIYSADKDLWMVDGLHCEPVTFERYRVSGFGGAEYKEVGNVKPKLIGRGTAWFWYQMIMGDKADNIPGLPYLSGRLAEIYIPLKKPNPKRKALQCGEAKAYAMMKGVTSNKQAFNRVAEAYSDHYGKEWRERLFEQAFLLWMRRVDDELDVLRFLETECGFSYQLTTQQRESLSQFMSLRQDLIAPEPTNEF